MKKYSPFWSLLLLGLLLTVNVHAANGHQKGNNGVAVEKLKKVHKACPEVKFVGHYALLGPYDFMDIYEAPDAETAHRVSLISRAEGALTAESWQALHYDQFLKVLEQVQG